MTFTVSLIDVLTILGCALVVYLIILVYHCIKTVKNVNKAIETNEPLIRNTLKNVDRIGEDTTNIYTKVIDKVLSLVGSKMEKPKVNKLDKTDKAD